jgi:hypothetical protein
LIVVAFLAATLPSLHDGPVTKAAEARAWVVARGMATSGDLLVPVYQGEPRLKKPPLQSWVQAGLMTVLGDPSVVVAGLGTVLVGLLFALAPWWLGKALGAESAGFVGALLLAGSRATLTWGGSPEHDVPFAAWTGLAFVGLARACAPDGRLRHVAASGLACGLALLTKDPFAPAFVAGTALVLQVRARRVAPGPAVAWWGWFLVGTLLPIGAWVAALAVRLGSVGALFDEALRQASGAGGAHTKGFLAGLVYHLGTLPKGLLPWAPVVAGLAVALAIRGRRDPAARAALAETPRFALVATLVCLVVLTLTPAKQEHYVLPALVPAALLAGHVVVRAARVLPGGAKPVVALLLVAAAAYAASRWVGARADLAAVDVAACALRRGARRGRGAARRRDAEAARPRVRRRARRRLARARNVAEVARDGEAEDLRDAVYEATVAPGARPAASSASRAPRACPRRGRCSGSRRGPARRSTRSSRGRTPRTPACAPSTTSARGSTPTRRRSSSSARRARGGSRRFSTACGRSGRWPRGGPGRTATGTTSTPPTNRRARRRTRDATPTPPVRAAGHRHARAPGGRGRVRRAPGRSS